VGLSHQTRRGDEVRAWYRGPFTLHLTQRSARSADGHLPLPHTSDQLRRVIPDGREDVGLAAGFEIGRLLAFSQPSVVSALMRWRGEQFGAERARQLAKRALANVAALKSLVSASIGELGRLVGRKMVLDAAADPAKVLAPDRPPVDPGRPLGYLTSGVDEVIATGFGFSLDEVRKDASTLGLPAALAKAAVPRAQAAGFAAAAAAHLKDGLSSAVEEVTAGVVTRRTVAGPALSATAARDRLDELLDAASRAREDLP
jgi:hypothetical protein